MRLYHFMKEEYALKALINRRLKVAEIGRLNDPFDCMGVETSRPEHEHASRRLKEVFADTRGLLCFSEFDSNPVQWAHYSENHKGICLGFDVSDSYLPVRDDLFSLTDKELSDALLFKVKYEHEKKKFPDNYLLENKNKNKNKDIIVMLDIFRTKYIDWRYENEYRVFPHLSEKTGELYFFDFNEKVVLREVILGCKSTLDKNELYRYLGDLRCTLEISHAYMCPKQFKILKRPEK